MKAPTPRDCLILLTSLILSTYPTQAQESETQGERVSLRKAKANREIEKLEQLQQGEEEVLRVTMVGKKTLEGARINLGTIEGDRLVTVSAKVRGQGTIGAAVHAENGWVYLPKMSLSDQWQEVRISKALKAGPSNPTVYFIHLPKEEIPLEGTAFEVTDLRINPGASTELPAKEVPSKRLEIEEVAPGVKLTEEDGVVCLPIRKSFTTPKIPFPQTSQPVNIYVRYRANSVKDRVQIFVRPEGAKQIIRTSQPTAPGWQWITFPSLTAGEIGENVGLDVWTGDDAAHPAALGAIVIGSGPAMDHEALNAVR